MASNASPSAPVLLDEVVLNVAEDAEFEAQARHCHVRSEIPAGSWEVRGDASLLHSAIENVVRNAIRYTREGTTVEIHLEKTEAAGGAEAVVRVTDCGSGVPADALEKLFQPFYRLDDARGRQTGGVGLGLAITERAVRFHGGRVAASEPRRRRTDGRDSLAADAGEQPLAADEAQRTCSSQRASEPVPLAT